MAFVGFFVCLVFCWITLLLSPDRHRLTLIAGWGLVFYAVYAGRDLPLVVELIAVTYLLVRGQGMWVLAGLVAALFVQFKIGYNITRLPVDLPAVATIEGRMLFAEKSARDLLIVPLGFSFLSFELLHYTIEHHRGRLRDVSFRSLCAFALYFPCRIAGPIKRFEPFVKAVRDAAPSFENIYRGIVRILIGLFKKLVLSDPIGMTVAELPDSPNLAAAWIHAATPGRAWMLVLAYSVQLYLDFSAYSDLAIGASRVLGITIPENFDRPYLSRSVQEFWTRWHISLSSWARDYVFTPTGRELFKTRARRSPALIATTAYLATFLVIGAWHGLETNFLLWGAYHGVLLSAYHVYRTRIPAAVAASRWFQSRIAGAAAVAVTFLLVTIGWAFFITNTTNAILLLRTMFRIV